MGVVYHAVQNEPMRREVALKLIKPGMDSSQVLARFSAERQALALLDHPGVARVYDGGVTGPEQGSRPYFVMELVHGPRITRYCEESELEIKDRIRLFLQVCDAVQHAHQRGIIHRDLKPSNVLVVEAEASEPQIKVIDFGVAKAIATDLAGGSMVSVAGQLIGTPEYMSPEQAALEGGDADTRTDIYALGVLLYELLTGHLPFDAERLRAGGISGAQRIIRDEMPPTPSARVARERASGGAPLLAEARALRGDLDWIVMKCLEKERDRRYGSASALADDLRRHLRHEPVTAGPPTVRYRTGKFVRRYRAGVGALTAVIVVLIAGVVGTSTQAGRASAAERYANEQWNRASTERDIAESINAFLTDDLLSSVQPSDEDGRGRDVTMSEVLDEAAKRIDLDSQPGGRFADKPLVEAGIRLTIAETLHALGRFEPAIPHATRALALRSAVLGDAHADSIGALNLLALLHTEQGLYGPAEEFYSRATELARTSLGESHETTLESLNGLAALYYRQGRYSEAEPIFDHVLRQRELALGEADPATLESMRGLAMTYGKLDKMDAAEALTIRTLAAQEHVLGSLHPSTLMARHNLAALYYDTGRHEEAKGLLLTLLPQEREVLGEEHRHTLMTMGNLAVLLKRAGEHERARAMYEQLLQIQERVLGEEHPDSLSTMSDLAVVCGIVRDDSRSDELTERAYNLRLRTLGKEHSDTQMSMLNMASMYAMRGLNTRAEQLILEVLEIKERTLGSDHRSTLVARNRLADLYLDTHRVQEAESVCRETIARAERALGNENTTTLTAMYHLGSALVPQKRYDEAEGLFEHVLDVRRSKFGDEAPGVLRVQNSLADLYRSTGRLEAAEACYSQVLALAGRALGEGHTITLSAMADLARTLAQSGRHTDALELFDRVIAVNDMYQRGAIVSLVRIRSSRALSYAGVGDFQRAESELLECRKLARDELAPESTVHGEVLEAMIELYRSWGAAVPGGGFEAKAAALREQLGAPRE